MDLSYLPPPVRTIPWLANFLFEHMKETSHGIVLTGGGRYDKSITFQFDDQSISNGYFKSAVLDPVAGHFNHDPVRFRPASSPFAFGLGQSFRCQGLETPAGDRN